VRRQFWTEEQIAQLIARYPHERTDRIAASIGRSMSSVYQRAQNMGLKKSPEYLASPDAGRTDGKRGGEARFKPGHATWNKGMKGLDIGGKATRFKPGQMPHNTHPVGSYRLDGGGILQRKISNDKGSNSKRWRGVHELVWAEENGPVPAGHIVVFKPGMRTNVLEEITANKVECITFAENMRRNTIHRLPKELAELCQLRGALNRQINKRASK
jgi:hypothetical protein